MQSVPAPAWRLRASRAPWLAATLALLLAGVAGALISSGGSSSHGATAISDLALIGGKPLQQASCAQWLQGTPDERAAVLAALKRNVGGPTPYGPGATLNTPDAYALLDRVCARPYARGFLLYELYTRASAFQATQQRFQ